MRIGSSDLPNIIPDPTVTIQKQLQSGVTEELRNGVERKPIQKDVREEKNKISTEELNKLIEEIRRKFDMLNRYLRIDIDPELEIPVAKIIEKDTNKVIRQIPPEYILELMKKIDQMLGILLEKEV